MITILKNQQKRARFFAAILLALFCINPALASDVMVVPQSHVSDFPNEYLGVQTRKVGFEYNDVVIPGSAGMDIIVTRRQSGTAVKFDNLLMKTSNVFASDRPLVSTTCLGDFKTLSIINKGTRLVPAGYENINDLPVGFIAVFANNIYLSCDKTNNTVAVLHFANGRKHTFTQRTYATNAFATDVSYATDTTTDRFGNSITYAYEADVQAYLPKRLKTITRSDGEVVTFVYAPTDIAYPTWSPQYLKEITYLGKKVQYDFTGGKLNFFTDAQGRQTHYEYEGYTGIGEQITKVTLPDGLTADYSHSALIDNSSFVLPSTVSLADMGYSGGQLRSKTISGPGINPRTHSYTGLSDGSVLVTHFNYKNDLELMTNYSFATGGRIYQIRRFEGALANEHDLNPFATHTLVYQQDIARQSLDGYAIGCLAATSITEVLTFDCKRWVMDTTTTTIANSDGNDIFVNHVIAHNAYSQPTEQTETFFGKSSTTMQTYEHDVNNWILNQPRLTQVGNVVTPLETVKEQTYYAKTHSSYPFYPEKTLAFGQWQQKVSEYHADGNIKKVEFNQKQTYGNTSSNRYESYNNYKRGQAQNVIMPARYSAGTISKTAIITDTAFGSTLNTTDYNGNKINYGYDHIGRPLYIDHVDNSVADTLYSYVAGTTTLGVVVTTHRCQLNTDKTACLDTSLLAVTPALTTTTTYDGFSNPVLVASSTTNQTLYKNMTYNVFNKPLFASYPATTSSYNQGLTFAYDALQRSTSMTQSGGGTAFTEYLAGNRIKATDAENNVTTTTYLDYDTPTYQQPILIVSPENLTTTLEVNVFGDVGSITQSGKNGTVNISQTQTNVYDSATHQICMVKRTDVGNTFISYNELGQVTWQAQGVSGNTCAANGATPQQKVTFGYDNIGDQRTVNFGDGTPQRTLTRDNNGNVKSIQGGGYSQSYNYTSINQLDDETLNVLADNKSFTLDYDYSSLGYLASLKYPGDTTQVNFAPNGFGQAAQAIRVYAQNDTVEFVKSGAAYYPTGAMDTFTYGNGVVHKSTINTRGMPEQLRDRIGNTDVVNLTYGYDRNSNITSITNPSESGIFGLSTLTYDGLDRLTTTVGGSGIGSSTLSYDSLGNIRGYKNTSLFNSHDLTYGYDSNFRLQSLSGAGSTGYDFAQASVANSDSHNSYNARGSVIHNGKRGFTYNLANQMTASGTNTYLYDGFNRRIKTQDSKGASYSMYSQSGTLLYRETPAGGINYIYLGKKLVAKEGRGVVEKSDSIKHYKPFGQSIETAEDDVGYTGHKFDTDLGLSYMQQRYYDPAVGRFYVNDPIGFRDVHSFNRYAYANNNPYRFTDPTGMASNEFVDGKNQLRQQGFSEQDINGFDEGASDVFMEASGANDLIAAGGSLADGDFSGAATSVAMVVAKPLKVASKVEKSKIFSKAKQDLVEMAKFDKKNDGVTQGDMDAYSELNAELPDPFPANKVRGLEVHPNRPHGQEPHGHVGPVNHIPKKIEE